MKTEGLYQWTDGYPVEITSWRQGEPNDYIHGEDCIDFFVLPSSHLVSSLWNDYFCSTQKGVICERRQGKLSVSVHKNSIQCFVLQKTLQQQLLLNQLNRVSVY